HGLHNLLTKSPLISYSGTRVAQDFVETPSQVYEGWVWEKEVLGKFARHYLTGETIPDDLLNKMLEAKNMLSGINALQQVFYGVLDFTLHDTYNPFSAIKTTEIVEQLQNDITPFKYMPDTHMEASFGHLIGYGAGYYGYLWSKVYARDIYSLFEENGIMDKTTVRRYRTIILEKGGTEDAFDLISQFLDRKPNNAAFIKSLGL
ncbi:MAG: oligopeptidase A, partial [Candidatus Marinimicrobia bacterium]|nr:oligopeptidase A [Candidatus Neomarinimicrobiota bacterium]